MSRKRAGCSELADVSDSYPMVILDLASVQEAGSAGCSELTDVSDSYPIVILDLASVQEAGRL